MRRKDIQGYEGLYYVTDTGEVWSYDRQHFMKMHNKYCTVYGKKLKPYVAQNGYIKVLLCSNYKLKNFLLHRLIAIAFIENKNNLPDINHIDANKNNNSIENLEWVTKSQNTRHMISLGRHKTPFIKGDKNPFIKIKSKDHKKIKTMLDSGLTVAAVSRIFKVNAGVIKRVKNMIY